MADTRKVAIITGAGSGIGRAVALALAADGYLLALAGRRISELEKTRELAAKSNSEMLVHVTDITDRLQVKALFQEVRQSYNRLDVLFNNAGTATPPLPLEDLSLEEWRKAVDTNLTGAFLCCQEAIRAMKSQDPKGGRIINNGSVSAFTPRPMSAAYTATKHAITGLTKSIALDGRADNIACSQINIGNAETEMTEPMAEGIVQPDGSTKVEDRMDVAHAASAVLYMANLPLEANVLFMTIKATNMPFEGRG